SAIQSSLASSQASTDLAATLQASPPFPAQSWPNSSKRCTRIAQNRRSLCINPVHLKNMLRQVQSDRSNLAHGWLPFAADSITAVWHSDAARGPSTPSFDHLAYPRSKGARSVIALTMALAWKPSSSGTSPALRWIQNVFSPADAAPLMSQEFAEMNPSSGFVTFIRSGARL